MGSTNEWRGGAHLETDGHDDIGLSLLWFVGLNPWIYQVDQLVENGLLVVSVKMPACQ